MDRNGPERSVKSRQAASYVAEAKFAALVPPESVSRAAWAAWARLAAALLGE